MGAESVIANYRDNLEVARVLGLKKAYDLNYRNHQMDGVERLEYRARLIFLFRLLRIDAVICYDPWGSYEENPDHYFTAQGVEAACWMAGGDKDYPEHFDAGLKPHSVTTKYYHARGPQLVNRVVDISSVIDTKVAANVANRAQGPGGETGARLRARLAAEGKRLPMLGDDDATANREYIKGASQQNCAVRKGPIFDLVLTAYAAVRSWYDHFCSARCPAPGTATRLPVGRCQTHASRLPVRTDDQVRQTGVCLRPEPQGSSRPVSQPHTCRRGQDAVTLPHRRTGRSGSTADRCRPTVSDPCGCTLGGMRTVGRQSISGYLSLLRGG